MQWQNIPAELRALPHWVVANHDKVPLDAKSGAHASPTDARTWAPFDVAVNAGYPLIGFVLSPHDPYCVIDLDDSALKPATEEDRAVHAKILEMFDTYTEFSVSGTGKHVVCKAQLMRGRRRGSVEVYSQDRYMIFTGNVLRNSPIRECQQLVELLVQQMPETQSMTLPDERPELVMDGVLYEMGLRAANGDKFAKLMDGNWRDLNYPSQSEADFSLLSMLAYYTPNNAQAIRIFRASGLGQRPKAKRDAYVNDMLAKMRAKELPPIDISQLRVPPMQPQTPTNAFPVLQGDEPQRGYQLPAGLLGEIASYIYGTSKFPTQEVSLGAAIGLMSALTARAYNISGTGLNTYTLLLAETGRGKEEADKGIGRILHTARNRMPIIGDFKGPSMIASGQGLLKVLDEKPCFVSVLGEFGDTMHQLNSPRASNAEKLIKKVLLDLFNKSGFEQTLGSSAYSDTTKNSKVIRAPCVSVIAEGSPSKFYANIGPADIADGFIPRFMCLEFTGRRGYGNEVHGQLPSHDMIERIVAMATTSVTVQNNNTVVQVLQDDAAAHLLKKFDHACTDRVNSSTPTTQEIWTRAHLKALRLAALVAVGQDWHRPIVNVDAAAWAIRLVERTSEHLISKFEKGEVGHGDSKLESEVRAIIRDYFALTPRQQKTYRVNEKLWQRGAFQRQFVWLRCARLSSFYNDRRGAARALDETLRNMTTNGVLMMLPATQMANEFGLRSPAYALGENF